VVLSGVVSSFYLKQMAQTVLLALDGINGVENLLVVGAPQSQCEDRFVPNESPLESFASLRKGWSRPSESLVAVAG
jgi:hypothetical protein